MRKIYTISDLQHLSIGSLQALFRQEAQSLHGAKVTQAISQANMDKISRTITAKRHAPVPKPPGI